MSIRFSPFKFILAIMGIIVIVILADFFVSNRWLKSTNFQFSSAKVSETLRIVQLSDLHNMSFGENNEELIDKINEQNPDIVLLTGDLITQTSSEHKGVLKTIEALTKIAPVYISLGNHEEVYLQNYPEIDLLEEWRNAGAEVLDYEYKDIEIKGNSIRVGGIYGMCYSDKMIEERPEESAFLNFFQNTDSLTLLMCHFPVVWKDTDSLDAWDVDYIFAGHLHGGQVRLPFVGAIYAPDQGWFPGRITGVFESEDVGTSGEKKRLILSSGLGSNDWVPRFHNRPEIVTVVITPEGN